MPLLDYVIMKSDGKLLSAVLGPSEPSIEAFRAAVSNPLLPSNIPLTQLLHSEYLQVSTLASDPFQVCAEGAHTTVWYVALVCTILFTLGMPALGLASLWSAGRFKGLCTSLHQMVHRCKFGRKFKRQLVESAVYEPPSHLFKPSVMKTTLLYFYDALRNSTLKKNMAWYYKNVY
jgi:hypothetical protein